MSHTTALTTYRVLAWVVGTLLIVLVFVAMPLQFFTGHGSGPYEVGDTLGKVLGIGHGFLYMAFLLSLLNLALRVRWLGRGVGWIRTLLVALAGTIPFLSFVAEHIVTKNVRAEFAQPAVAGGSSSSASLVADSDGGNEASA
jgi:integral membrane protein